MLSIDPDDPDALIALAIAQKGLGQFEESLETASTALSLRPHDPLALNTMGLSAYYLNRGDQALAAFDDALLLQPEVAALHRHRGMVLVGLSRHTEARLEFEHALKISPHDVPSLNQLASLHLRHDRMLLARDFAQRALETKPEDPEALFYLARSLAQLKDSRGAETYFERACQVDPGYLTPYALWLIEEGRLEEAGKLLIQRLDGDPRDGMALHYLLETQGFPVTHEQLSLLEDLAQDGSGLPSSQAFANYALGKAREREKDFKSAFAAYHRANDRFFGLKLAHQHDLVGTIDREVSDAKQLFSRERLAELRKLGIPFSRPIFIVGMIRSGTTLLEQIVSSHSQVYPAGELRYWMEHGPAALSSLDDLAMYAQGYEALLKLINGTSPRITDKMPLNLRFLGLISSAFPNAKILWIRRDPMDTCLSVYTTPFTDPPVFSYNLRNIGYVYRKYDELMAHWKEVLPPGTLFEVTYEELVANQAATTEAILDFCGLPFEEACLSPERNVNSVRTPSSLQVRKAVYRTSVQRWCNFEPWLDDLKEGLGTLAPKS